MSCEEPVAEGEREADQGPVEAVLAQEELGQLREAADPAGQDPGEVVLDEAMAQVGQVDDEEGQEGKGRPGGAQAGTPELGRHEARMVHPMASARRFTLTKAPALRYGSKVLLWREMSAGRTVPLNRGGGDEVWQGAAGAGGCARSIRGVLRRVPAQGGGGERHRSLR